jgi:hypothetical protein
MNAQIDTDNNVRRGAGGQRSMSQNNTRNGPHHVKGGKLRGLRAPQATKFAGLGFGSLKFQCFIPHELGRDWEATAISEGGKRCRNEGFDRLSQTESNPIKPRRQV